MKKLLTILLFGLSSFFVNAQIDSTKGCEERFHPNYTPGLIQKVVPQSTGYSKNVNVYFEIDSTLNAQLTGVGINVSIWMDSVFGRIQTIYFKDSIRISKSGLKIWTNKDTYKGNGQGTYLPISEFGDSMIAHPPSNSDVAMLLSNSHRTGGGIAWVDGLCFSTWGGRIAVVDYIDGNWQDTIYTWTVDAITHELGHLLGSNHTHDCVWTINGVTNQAIDGCGQNAGYGGGCNVCPCIAGPYPPISSPFNGKGTIMSYCHLTNATTDLRNRFHPLVKTLIRDNVNSKICLVNPNPITCPAPTILSTINIGNNGATLHWNTVPSDSFLIRYYITAYPNTIFYKQISNPNTTSITIVGLLSGTNYTWKIRTYCGNNIIIYSNPISFTTTGPQACNAKAPIGVLVNNINSSGCTMNWNPQFCDSFLLRYYKTSTPNNIMYKRISSGSASTINLTGLSSGTQYTTLIRSYCGVNKTGNYSSKVTFNTSLEPEPKITPTYRDEDDFKVYPNPSNYGFNIDGGRFIGSTMYLLNSIGETIFISPLEEHNFINSNGMSKGIYYLYISQNGDLKIVTKIELL